MNMNGSEDAESNCLEAGEGAALVAPAITDSTHKVLQEDESSNEDLFANMDINEGELKQNELVIYTDSN